MKPKKKSGKGSPRATGSWTKRDSNTARFVEAALNNEKYRARTIKDIAREAKVSTADVLHAIKHDAPLRDKVKVFPGKSKDGSVLLTTKDRFSKEASVKDKFIGLFSAKLPELEDE